MVTDSSSHHPRFDLTNLILFYRSHGSNRACSKGNQIGSSTNRKPSSLSAADLYFLARFQVFDPGRHRTSFDILKCVLLDRTLILFLFLSRVVLLHINLKLDLNHSCGILWHGPTHTRIHHLRTHHLPLLPIALS